MCLVRAEERGSRIKLSRRMGDGRRTWEDPPRLSPLTPPRAYCITVDMHTSLLVRRRLTGCHSLKRTSSPTSGLDHDLYCKSEIWLIWGFTWYVRFPTSWISLLVHGKLWVDSAFPQRSVSRNPTNEAAQNPLLLDSYRDLALDSWYKVDMVLHYIYGS
jgi:hypothetical protein